MPQQSRQVPPSACLPRPRVLQTLHLLKDLLPDTHIVLMALLPRGGGWPGAPAHWPSVFTQAFDIVNAHYR